MQTSEHSAHLPHTGIIFQKDLTKQVTHLIAHPGKGNMIKPTNKIKFAQQYDYSLGSLSQLIY